MGCGGGSLVCVVAVGVTWVGVSGIGVAVGSGVGTSVGVGGRSVGAAVAVAGTAVTVGVRDGSGVTGISSRGAATARVGDGTATGLFA